MPLDTVPQHSDSTRSLILCSPRLTEDGPIHLIEVIEGCFSSCAMLLYYPRIADQSAVRRVLAECEQ